MFFITCNNYVKMEGSKNHITLQRALMIASLSSGMTSLVELADIWEWENTKHKL